MILAIILISFFPIRNGENCTIESKNNSISIGDVRNSPGSNRFANLFFSDSIKIIEKSAFSECKNLQTLVFQGSIKSINEYAFYNLPLLRTIEFKAKVGSISKFAFGKHPCLSDIIFPPTIDNLECAFTECNSLINIVFPSSNKKYSYNEGLVLSNSGADVLFGIRLSEITIPRSAVTIMSYSFYKCDGLETVKFNEQSNLKYIKEYAFYGCTNLLNIVLPDTVTIIEKMAMSKLAIDIFVVPLSLSEMDVTSLAFNKVNHIIVPKENQCFVVSSNSLMDIENTIVYITERTAAILIIPKTVKKLAPGLLSPLNVLEMIEIDNENEDFCACSNVIYNRLKTSIVAVAGSFSGRFDVPRNVETIEDYAFYNISVSSVDFEEKASNIVFKRSCFKYSKLEIITLPKGNISFKRSCFAKCNQLSEVYFNGNVIEVNESAFKGCELLSTITFSKSTVDAICSKAFKGCTSLISVALGDSIKEISDYAFAGDTALAIFNVPDNLTLIGAHAFENCESLSKIDFSESLETISAYSFYNCSSLKGVAFPPSLRSIETAAFYGCSILDTAYFSENSIKRLASDAFAFCDLKTFMIPNSLVFFGCGAVSNNFGLEYFTVDAGNTEFSVFAGCLYSQNLSIIYSVPSALTNIPICYHCTSISYFAFDGTLKLIVISIDKHCTIKEIPKYWFYGAFGLQYLTLPPSIKSLETDFFTEHQMLRRVGFNGKSELLNIPRNCFKNMKMLEAVEFEEAPFLADIRAAAFEGCSSLKQFVCPQMVQRIGRAAFCGCSRMIYIMLPSELKELGLLAFRDCFSLSTVAYCGNNQLRNQIDAFADTLVMSVFVPINYQSSSFCGVPVTRSLDESCAFKKNII